ncbi:uncharacterized protein [Tursiops truncatus]|uniref:uncharacterized protein isoform X4 n=1 Tax=Tursiops truncatus TaxID=9739 RepID=UPI003CCFCA5A
MSATRAKKVKMATKSCPECDQQNRLSGSGDSGRSVGQQPKWTSSVPQPPPDLKRILDVSTLSLGSWLRNPPSARQGCFVPVSDVYGGPPKLSPRDLGGCLNVTGPQCNSFKFWRNMEIFSLKYIYYIFDVNNRESFLYNVLNGTLLNDAPIEALPERSSLAPTRRGIHC